MSLRLKFTLYFTLLSALVLLGFSIFVHVFYADYRQNEFFLRLEERAFVSARFVLESEKLDPVKSQQIKEKFLAQLTSENLLVYNVNTKTQIFVRASEPNLFNDQIVKETIKKGKIYKSFNDYQLFGLDYVSDNQSYVIIVSAYDQFGYNKLENLQWLLVSGFFIGLGLIAIIGWLFSKSVLSPLISFENDIDSVKANELTKRVPVTGRVSEIRRLAERFNALLNRLEEAFGFQQIFIQLASHELRTPITAVVGEIEVILSRTRDAEDYRKALENTHKDTLRLKALIDQLLNYARSIRDPAGMKFQPIRIDEVLITAVNQAQRNYPTRTILIEFDNLPEEETELTVVGNETLVFTAFLNVIDNALKYTKGKVWCRIGLEQKQVWVQVQDEGEGIAPNEQSRIFDPFYRIIGQSEDKPGSGLGLAIVERILNLHHGSVRLESSPGVGTKLKLIFPLS